MTGPLATRDRELARAGRELDRLRAALAARGVQARGLAFISADPGGDLARLATEQRVDLVLVDGRRPLLGAGAPGGAVGSVLKRVPCDVAVLVDQEHVPVIDDDHPVYVASGETAHDEAALVLGTAIAGETGASLRVAGAAAGAEATAAEGGLLVVGMPAEWRRRGLGRVRAGLARSARVPTLFVRSGSAE